MKIIEKFSAIIMVFMLAACGFQPMYKDDIASKKSDIALWKLDIAPVIDTQMQRRNRDGLQKTRLGQLLQDRLQDLTKAQGGGDQLNISLTHQVSGFGIRPDASASQEKVILKAQVLLLDPTIDPGNPLQDQQLLMLNLSESLSYDLVQGDFANVTKREDTLRRLSLKLADRIYRQLLIFYRQQQ